MSTMNDIDLQAALAGQPLTLGWQTDSQAPSNRWQHTLMSLTDQSLAKLAFTVLPNGYHVTRSFEPAEGTAFERSQTWPLDTPVSLILSESQSALDAMQEVSDLASLLQAHRAVQDLAIDHDLAIEVASSEPGDRVLSLVEHSEAPAALQRRIDLLLGEEGNLQVCASVQLPHLNSSLGEDHNFVPEDQDTRWSSENLRSGQAAITLLTLAVNDLTCGAELAAEMVMAHASKVLDSAALPASLDPDNWVQTSETEFELNGKRDDASDPGVGFQLILDTSCFSWTVLASAETVSGGEVELDASIRKGVGFEQVEEALDWASHVLPAIKQEARLEAQAREHLTEAGSSPTSLLTSPLGSGHMVVAIGRATAADLERHGERDALPGASTAVTLLAMDAQLTPVGEKVLLKDKSLANLESDITAFMSEMTPLLSPAKNAKTRNTGR
jgi:hypothetical protein